MTLLPRRPQLVAVPLVERVARVLWDVDEEWRRRADWQQFGRAKDITSWDCADEFDRAEYRDKARSVLDRVLFP
jgi:hypothetical protein